MVSKLLSKKLLLVVFITSSLLILLGQVTNLVALFEVYSIAGNECLDTSDACKLNALESQSKLGLALTYAGMIILAVGAVLSIFRATKMGKNKTR